MRNRSLLWALALLNAVLATGLSWKLGWDNAAQAQVGGRADYIMLPADIPGATSGIVYMIDTRNGLLSAFVFEINQRRIDVMPPIDLNRIIGGGGVR